MISNAAALLVMFRPDILEAAHEAAAVCQERGGIISYSILMTVARELGYTDFTDEQWQILWEAIAQKLEDKGIQPMGHTQ